MCLRNTFALLIALAALGGCSSSSVASNPDGSLKKDGSSSNGDASTGDSSTPGMDSGFDSGFDAGMDVMQYPDGQCAAMGCSVEAGSFSVDAGSTWTALYHDYFGTTGVASCAGSPGNCHGSTGGDGYNASGFLCPPGNKDACYSGITSQGMSGADIITPDAGYDASIFDELLCQCDGNGAMPYGCCYIFQPDDMQRIANWVNAGSQNN